MIFLFDEQKTAYDMRISDWSSDVCSSDLRHHGGSLTRAAFLSARNDALANLAFIAAAIVSVFVWRSAWPDLIVGLAIAAINADAAREVWQAARREHRAAEIGRAHV